MTHRQHADYLREAMAYGASGWLVFPVAGKAPLTRHGLLDATLDPAEIVRLFANPRATGVAISCGPSGLLIVDLDGPEAATSWATLTAGRDRPRTRTAVTANGWHLYFEGDGPSSAGRLGRRIDTRGRGGYIVAPPSRHPGGSYYRWADPSVPVVPAPDWLLAALRPVPPAVTGERRGLPAGRDATAYGAAALTGLASEMRATPEGCRNHRLNAVAYRAGRLHAAGEIDADTAREVLVEAALAAGLGVVEARRTCSSGFAAGLRLPAARAPR